MATSILYGVGLTPSTHGDPNGLPVKNPYPADWGGPLFISTAWANQGKRAIFPGHPVCATQNIRFDVVGQSPSETIRIAIKRWARVFGSWVNDTENPAVTLTGAGSFTVENPGNDPVYLEMQLGTCSISYDGGRDELWQALPKTLPAPAPPPAGPGGNLDFSNPANSQYLAVLAVGAWAA
jgi:hypothetical protein